MRRFLPISGILLIVIALLAGCGEQSQPSQTGGTPGTASAGKTSTPTEGSDIWALLRQKPLHLPTLAPGAACPVDVEKQVSPDVGLAPGDGPLYPVAPWKHGTYNYAGVAVSSDGWYYLKVLWAAQPHFQGQALIRGHQLGGTNELRFSDGGAGSPAEPELHFVADGSGANSSGWNTLATYTRVRAPGCYAYQVDGASFSEVVAFQAVGP